MWQISTAPPGVTSLPAAAMRTGHISVAFFTSRETARSIREDFLHQDSFHEIDTYTSPEKQYLMMKLVMAYYDEGLKALNEGANINDLVQIESREAIGRFKYTEEENVAKEYDRILEELQSEMLRTISKEDF